MSRRAGTARDPSGVDPQAAGTVTEPIEFHPSDFLTPKALWIAAQGWPEERSDDGLPWVGGTEGVNLEEVVYHVLMPQALAAVYIHLVFSTKERRAFLRDPMVRAELHAYLSGVSKQLDCPAVQVGGVQDHVHVLARIGRTITLADWVKELKRVSNLWLKERGRTLADFQWQSGYACFSVSQSNLAKVAACVANQEEHHRELSFEDEFRALLQKHNIEFDERYVWD